MIHVAGAAMSATAPVCGSGSGDDDDDELSRRRWQPQAARVSESDSAASMR